ncbi:putative uncharacterized protein FLJ46235 [Theropithecus gelada]|uniref:putative uncharacterized protein FLJ46235 n=1 Tax=Theropithecus gelada TaxID=9565 RepID=UPI000DC18BDB|nr:putative uncharacterized protein FLJ46235 [Theropithecus gelada]
MVCLGPYPTLQQSLRMRLLLYNSIHRPSSNVMTASLGPAPASQSSLQAQNFLKSTSPDPAPASHCHPKGQLFPQGHLPRPSSCPPSASQWPGQAQLLRDNGLSRPSFCLTDIFPKQAPTCLLATLMGPDPASH